MCVFVLTYDTKGWDSMEPKILAITKNPCKDIRNNAYKVNWVLRVSSKQICPQEIRIHLLTFEVSHITSPLTWVHKGQVSSSRPSCRIPLICRRLLFWFEKQEVQVLVCRFLYQSLPLSVCQSSSAKRWESLWVSLLKNIFT